MMRFPIVPIYLWSFSVNFATAQPQWKLIHEEDFSSPLPDGSAQWRLEPYQEPFDTIMDDAGDWYKNDYGPDFTDALNSFHTYRKEFAMGQNGWLTASFSARDSNKDGNLASAPTLQVESVGNRNVLTMDTPSHTGGVILRNTKTLPEAYRIEYKLTRLDRGGRRNGSIVHSDGKINGYDVDTCKTQHPWGEGSQSRGWTGDASLPYCEWQSVRTGAYAYNGFHFLAIVDFADPAPRNNHFWHYRRKILMDSFSQHPDRFGDGTGGQVCNSNTLEYYNYSDSDSYVTLNMWVSGLPGTWTPNPGGLTGSSQRFITDCNGGKATRGIQSAGELLTPDDMQPDEYYTFAIERSSTGYTLEASGKFARVGFKKYRFYRPFVEDDLPIWHYNVKASEYDGRYDGDLQQLNWAFGSQTWANQWPAGSSYPDYFVIGDLYTNVYEGSASITDIRYFEPDPSAPACDPTVLMLTGDRINSDSTISRDGYFLYQRGNGNLQVWAGTLQNRGSMIWESGVIESLSGASYYTIVQGDSNVITWRQQSTGDRVVVWKTSTVNIDGTYAFVVECPGRGGGVALYQGRPTQGDVSIWSQDAKATSTEPIATPPAAPVMNTPTTTTPVATPPASSPARLPTSSPQQSELPCKEPIVFLNTGDTLYVEESVQEENHYLYQHINGNLELREGAPDSPGRLLWETGETETTIDVYYTKLQGDSNLVTWRVTRYEESAIWAAGSTSMEGMYTLELERCGRGGLVVKNEDGQAIWNSSLLIPWDSQPTTQPTTFSETTEQSSSGASGSTVWSISSSSITVVLLIFFRNYL